MMARMVALVALALSLLGVVLMAGHEAEEQAQPLLLPALKEHLGDVTRIDIRSLSAADQKVTLDLKDGAWRIEEKSDYPADFSRIAEFADNIVSLKVVELKTDRPENYDRLGLADEGEAAGTRIDISTATGRFSLVTGNRAGTRGSWS